MDKDQSNPESRAHARLSASQTKRWMTCPGSMRLIDDLPRAFRPQQSLYAALGTAAHSLVEECLRNGQRDSRRYKGYFVCADGTIERSMRDPAAFEVDYDMMDAVDVMLATVRDEIARLGPSAEMRFEHRFDLSWVRPDMFGTNDVSLSLFLDELVVIDYKHGQGVPVEVCYPDPSTGELLGNTQLMYYALGAARGYDFTHDRVTLIVVQPRCPHPKGGVRRFTVTMRELLEFRDHLAAAADRVDEAYSSYDGSPGWRQKYLRAGDHCKTAFCSMLPVCPALHELAQKEAMADFDVDEPYRGLPKVPAGVEGLAKALRWVPVLDARNRAIEALAQRLAEQGVRVPGNKLVRKKANRSWSIDASGVASRLRDAGLDPKDFMTEPELRSPAQVERLGPEARKIVNGHKLPNDESWIVEPLAAKGVGGLTLAPEDDPRAEVVIDPAADFPEEPVVDVGEGDT